MKIILYLFCLTFITVQADNDRKAFYNALSGNSLEEVEKSIIKYERQKSGSKVNAYLGALYMKKAFFLKVPKEKMETFRKGQNMLESEISNNPNNTEYRFIRLILQEHSPKILKYNSNIEEDTLFVINNFSRLDTEMKQIITDYSGSSKHIKPEELK